MNLSNYFVEGVVFFWLGLAAGSATRADLWRLAQLVLALSLFPLFFYLIAITTE